MAQNKILGPDGRPIQKPAPELIATPSAYYRTRSNDAAALLNLSPTQIRNWLLEAEAGNIESQAALFEEMERRDPELDGHLRTRKMGVASLSWQILPADESEEAADVAAYCRDVVAGIGVEASPGQPMRGIRAAIFDLLDAVPKGFAALEIDWRTSRAEWRPAALHWRPQRWFTLGDDGMTLYLRGEDYDEQIELNPTNWILHTAQARSGFLSNWSLLRSCARPFIMRQYGYKDWMAFVEVYGMPPRLGRLREGVPFDSAEADQLEAALAAMGTDMYAMVREGNTIEVLDTPGPETGEIYSRVLDHAEKELTKAILGQLLTSGGEGGGSYALGRVQNLIRRDLLITDALGLAETLTQQLLYRIVALNKGPGAPAPAWTFDVEEPADLDARAGVLEKLGRAFPGRVRVSLSALRKEFSLAEPEDEEDAVVLGSEGGGGMFSVSRESPFARFPTPPNQARLSREADALGVRAPKLYGALCQADVAPWRVLDELAGAWLSEKRIATRAAWEALSPAGKQRAWWVTGLGEQPTALAARELQGVLLEGQTENEFLNRLEARGLSVPEGVEAGPGQVSAWHARLVHRNNRWAAQNAAQYQRLQQDRDVRPYGQWLCHSPCEICAPLCGNIARLDGPFFSRHWPQIHHGCQCEVISVSADEIGEDEDLRRRLDQQDPMPLDAPPEFSYHPGDAFYLEGRGGAPASELGLKDAAILATLKLVEAYI